jgi:ABC-2 type transport system permease protein
MKSILNNILKVAKREIQRMSSKSIYLLVLIVFPALTTLFFSSLFSEGVPTRMPVAIVDLDQSATSRKMTRNINATPTCQVVMNLQSEAEAMSELRTGHIYGFVILPNNLQADILSSRQATISYYYHNSFLNAGGLVQSSLKTVLQSLSAGINIQKREAKGQEEGTVLAQVQPVQLSIHQLFNPMASYTDYISTIVMPIMLQLFILLMTTYSIGIEIKEKTSREWLKMSGKSIVVALTGKLLPYTIIFFILMMFQNFILYKVLQVPLNSSICWLMAASFLFVISYQAVGIFWIGLLPLMRHAINLSAFYGILAFSLCGFSFPVDSMPPVVQYWASAFPVRHYMMIFQNQLLTGFGPGYSYFSYIFLMLFLMLPFIILVRLKSALIYQNYFEKNLHHDRILS